jgi:hypothetical protein
MSGLTRRLTGLTARELLEREFDTSRYRRADAVALASARARLRGPVSS